MAFIHTMAGEVCAIPCEYLFFVGVIGYCCTWGEGFFTSCIIELENHVFIIAFLIKPFPYLWEVHFRENATTVKNCRLQHILKEYLLIKFPVRICHYKPLALLP